MSRRVQSGSKGVSKCVRVLSQGLRESGISQCVRETEDPVFKV